MKKVLHSELDYTGGGSWCTWGELEDGTIFIGGNNEGFGIYDKSILDKVVESDDWRVAFDVYDATAEVEAIGYTDDNSEDTFEIWLQVYEQNGKDCVDLEWLLDDLYEFHGKNRSEEEEKVDRSEYKNMHSDNQYDTEDMAKALCVLLDKRDPWLAAELEEALYNLQLTAQNEYNGRCYRVLWNALQNATDYISADENIYW